MLADIPDNISDNDPELNKRMQSVFDKYYLDYKARFAGKTLIERIEGCSFTIPEIDIMLNDCIEEQNKKLNSFDLMTLSPNKRIKVKRYLTFLEAKKAINQPIPVKCVKSFPQYLMNLDNKNEQFAELLKPEFSGRGLKIRYMIEALREEYILPYTVSDLTLYNSLVEYIGTHIGTYNGIFNFKFDFDKKPNPHKVYKDRINKAHDRIRSILKTLAVR